MTAPAPGRGRPCGRPRRLSAGGRPVPTREPRPARNRAILGGWHLPAEGCRPRSVARPGKRGQKKL